jgi:hypothetical protein
MRIAKLVREVAQTVGSRIVYRWLAPPLVLGDRLGNASSRHHLKLSIGVGHG